MAGCWLIAVGALVAAVVRNAPGARGVAESHPTARGR